MPGRHVFYTSSVWHYKSPLLLPFLSVSSGRSLRSVHSIRRIYRRCYDSLHTGPCSHDRVRPDGGWIHFRSNGFLLLCVAAPPYEMGREDIPFLAVRACAAVFYDTEAERQIYDPSVPDHPGRFLAARAAPAYDKYLLYKRSCHRKPLLTSYQSSGMTSRI